MLCNRLGRTGKRAELSRVIIAEFTAQRKEVDREMTFPYAIAIENPSWARYQGQPS